ncbi:MAG: hypothetical protein ACREOU_15735 [Candidatus Eiseniibacteriota bacterium]
MRRSATGLLESLFACFVCAIVAAGLGGCARQEETSTLSSDTTHTLVGESVPTYADTLDPGSPPAGDPAPPGTVAQLLDRAKVRESDLGAMIQASQLERADDLALEISSLVATAVARGDFRTGQRDSLKAIAGQLKVHAQALAEAASMGDVERSKDEFKLLQGDLRTAESAMGPGPM